MLPPHEWYQTAGEVVVIFKVKDGVQSVERLECVKGVLNLSLRLMSGQLLNVNLNLRHSVVGERCSHKLFDNKVEVKLPKGDGVHWSKLEVDQPQTSKSNAPGQAKNWDKIAEEAMAEENDSNDLMNFFQNIYSDLDDDGKRAMMKSMVESKGTVLSTNWNEVGSKKVDVKPPEGVDMKP